MTKKAKDSSGFIFHIGMPRCASTFLQKFVFPQANGDGMVFIDRQHEGYEAINRIMHEIASKPFYEFDEAETKKSVNNVFNGSGKTVLISNEALAGEIFDSFKSQKSIVDKMKAVFPSARIIFVFRRQYDMFESMYKAAVRMGYIQRFEYFMRYRDGEFVAPQDVSRNKHFMDGTVSAGCLDYTPMISYMTEVFGKNNVLALPYEMFADDREGFIKRIDGFLGTDISSKNIEPGTFNASYPDRMLGLVRFMNRFIISDFNGLGFIPYRRKLPRKKNGILNWLDRAMVYTLDIDRLYAKSKRLFSTRKKIMNPRIKDRVSVMYDMPNKDLSKLTDIDLSVYGYHGRK